jgi:hypothetical protein
MATNGAPAPNGTTNGTTSPSLADQGAQIASLASAYPADAPEVYPPDPNVQAKKLELIGLAKNLITSLMDGGMLTQTHSLQMAELVCVRSLLGMGVFEKLPEEGVIGTKELSEKSGVQDKLLDRLMRVCVGTGFVTQKQMESGEYGYGHTKFSRAYGSYPGLFFRLM